MVTLNHGACSPGADKNVNIQWEVVPPIPPDEGKTRQFGVAGPTAGAHGNYMLVAGGANFEDAMPWRGGTKLYHDEIYLLEMKSDGHLSWKQCPGKLPYPMAYAACVTIPEGVLSIGGENAEGPVSDVFLFSFEDGKINCDSLPSLPEALTSSGATVIGEMVFVQGGLTASGASATFYSLNLANQETGWQRLSDLPVPMSHSVVVSQSDGSETCIYVIGGRNKTSEVHTFRSEVWKYSPSSASWSKVSEISTGNGHSFGLSAGTGVARGNSEIVLFGGDKGIYFNQTERLNHALEAAGDEQTKKEIWARKDSLLTNHPGFSKEILGFDTRTQKWNLLGEIHGDSPATTVAFCWKGWVMIPSGEIRPGIRTPNVLAIKIE